MTVLAYQSPDPRKWSIASSRAGLGLVALGAANWLPVMVMFLYTVIAKEIRPREVSAFWWTVLAWCAVAAIVQSNCGVILYRGWSPRARSVAIFVNGCNVAVIVGLFARLSYLTSSFAHRGVAIAFLLIPTVSWVAALAWSSFSLRRIGRV